MIERLTTILLALLLASPASAAIITRGAGHAIYPASSPCTAGTVTHDGTQVPVAECAIGEAFHVVVPFYKDAANAWSYRIHWESDSATTDFACWHVEAAAYPDGTLMTAAVTENVADVPSAAGDANQAANTRQMTAWSAAVAVRNAASDVDCTGAPSSCEHAEVRLIVTRVECAANDLAGDAKVRLIQADVNP